MPSAWSASARRRSDSSGSAPVASSAERSCSETSRVTGWSEMPKQLIRASEPPRRWCAHELLRRRGRSRRADGRISPNPKPSPSEATGKRTSVRSSSGRTAVTHRTGEELARRHLPCALGAGDHHGGVQAGGDGRQLGRRVGVGDAAADGAPAPDLPVADPGQRKPQQGYGGCGVFVSAPVAAAPSRPPGGGRCCARSGSSSRTALMSTSTDGRPRRIASTGTSDWPPAITLAPSRPSSARASSVVPGRT